MKLDIKRHTLGASLIGVMGLLTGLGMNHLYDTGGTQFLPNKGDIVPIIAIPSAALAGAIFANMFGHHGPLGWVWSFIGGVLATMLGAFLGGSLLAPKIGGVFGVLTVFEYLITQPVLLAAWCVMLAISHQVFVFIMPYRR